MPTGAVSLGAAQYGRSNVVLREWTFDHSEVKLYKSDYSEDGSAPWYMAHDMLGLCIERVSNGQVYFEPEASGIGGALGELVYLPAQRPFEWRWRASQEINLCCYFLRQSSDRLKAACSEYLPQFLSINSPILKRLMLQLKQEANSIGPYSDMIVEGICLQLSGMLARHIQTSGTSFAAHGWRFTSELNTLIQSLDGRRGTPTLTKLAQSFGYSDRHFARIFTQATGKTYSRYVSEKRLELAKDMLLDSRKPVKEISFELGFSGSHDFSRAFRRAVGRSPMRYRCEG